jgi:4-hydroxy-3-methylbut-2-en-1-yl diphosphate synthase IspG/GcpE
MRSEWKRTGGRGAQYREQSIFDWRRYGHWDTSAEKARLTAFLLWQYIGVSKLAELTGELEYSSGDADLAMREGFRRESAVALELIVKAVIAKQLELERAPPSDRVPATHDILALWVQAELPALSREDRYRLLLFKSVLMWSGRYATPRTAKVWADENAAFDALNDPPPKSGEFVFRTPITFSWEDFDRLYQMAKARLLELHKSSRAPAVLIVRCRGCDHQIEPDLAELSGLQTWAAVRDYCDRVACPRCGRQEIDVRTER